ncbi:MAG: tRNA (guanosine(46)-N7)-methyltransferase TrmB [Roseburia sp.]|nr:tRNA (guanosine(46)-N7)-methyltransferase TrmB [Roseburia sp.]
MRLRNITGSREAIADSRFVVQDPAAQKGCWSALFGNDHPIHIEIGMGKGRFLMELAARNPQVNYIGIEKYSSVLLRAIQKMEERELPNLRLIRMDAEELCEVFDRGEVAKIYLNFSDPWPKDRHAKRRLPSRRFLERYHQILTADGRIEFKTDNAALFDFALEELAPAGWRTEAVTRDLHHDAAMAAGNIMTEYEERFSSIGNPIYKYIIYRDKTNE